MSTKDFRLEQPTALDQASCGLNAIQMQNKGAHYPYTKAKNSVIDPVMPETLQLPLNWYESDLHYMGMTQVIGH